MIVCDVVCRPPLRQVTEYLESIFIELCIKFQVPRSVKAYHWLSTATILGSSTKASDLAQPIPKQVCHLFKTTCRPRYLVKGLDMPQLSLQRIHHQHSTTERLRCPIKGLDLRRLIQKQVYHRVNAIAKLRPIQSRGSIV